MRTRGREETETQWALPKESAAMPSDMRKAFGLPVSEPFGIWATPSCWGTAPELIIKSWTEAQSASAHQAA